MIPAVTFGWLALLKLIATGIILNDSHLFF